MLRGIYLCVLVSVFTCKGILASNPINMPSNRASYKLMPAASSVSIEDFRFGAGVGFGLYVTNQLDYKITTDYGDFKELIPTYFGAIYKKVGDNLEIGAQARFGSLFTLKSENTQGSRCDFNELQLSAVYSFTGDVSMQQKKVTVNGVLGLGLINFRSKYFTVNTRTQQEAVVYASVGYGDIGANKAQLERETALIGQTGIAIGYQFSDALSAYWETTYNMSSTNKMSGNLFKRSLIPPDGYLYSSVGIFVRFGSKRGQLSCPKF